MCLSSLHSKISIEGILFSGILIPEPSKLVCGIHKIWFDDPFFCLLYQFFISFTNALISTVYWLLISGCLLRGDVVPYFLVEGYKSDPVLSFFNYSVEPIRGHEKIHMRSGITKKMKKDHGLPIQTCQGQKPVPRDHPLNQGAT